MVPLGRVARLAAPLALLGVAARPGAGPVQRVVCTTGLLVTWGAAYARYRQRGLVRTREEWELMRTATLEAFSRHYNESVPTVEEELDIWGEYHGHRHQMRYRLLADRVREHATPGADVLDLGCGAALVADLLAEEDLRYVGLDFGGHHIKTARDKHAAGTAGRLRATFVRGDAEHLPFADASFDVVVWSEVIEHLMRPELAVWEVSRVLRPGGVLVMTTNNASEMPLRFPLSDPLCHLEKAIGFHHDALISHRPWVWPWPVDRALLSEGSPDVWMPHTWHKQAETRRILSSAGLDTLHASTFEFPPPQSASARWLDQRGSLGRQGVDVVEAVCQATPLLNRLGCHLLMVARRSERPVPPEPPPGTWPGPFSS